MKLNPNQVAAHLNQELKAIREFESNASEILGHMRFPNLHVDFEAESLALRYNQQMAALYLERASAVLELLGEARRGELLSGDDLESAIEAIKS